MTKIASRGPNATVFKAELQHNLTTHIPTGKPGNQREQGQSSSESHQSQGENLGELDQILPQHWAELQESGIAADVAALNVCSFGPGTDRHWESERAELVAHARLKIQTESTANNGHNQGQAGHLAGALIALDSRYQHLSSGGWRSLSDTLPGLPVFNQWKPDQPRQKGKRNEAGEWMPQFDEEGRPVPVKYEAPPKAPDGGGLLLPNVPERCWRLICERQELPFPDAAALAEGFWPWALRTSGLEVLATEGWKKALSAVSAGFASVALPGITMGIRRNPDDSRRLIVALQVLSAKHTRKRCTMRSKGNRGRRWLIAFDAEAKPTTAAKVGAAAGALASALRSAGGQPKIAWLPLLPGTTKTGLDDLLVARGPEAITETLAATAARPVLPSLRAADLIAPAGAYLGQVCPIPAPQLAPLVLLQAPMGCGKTRAIKAAVLPLQADGVPLLPISHRRALGQALAKEFGIAWEPEHGSDERQLGAGFCLDSCCPNSRLKINGHSWSGAVVVLDELMQQLEHLLLADGTTIGRRRALVLRTITEIITRASQVIGSDAQLSDWGLNALERITGRRALLIRSEHQPMKGRSLTAPKGFKGPQHAGDAFRITWAELVDAGEPFLCWSSAQQGRYNNSAQNLAQLHLQGRPADLVDVIDSTTPEIAEDVAADPDGFVERRMAEAERLGVNYALYTTPAISSGISWERWRPAAVIAYSGGCIAPEHVAQALARVRCPEVPAFVFAPESATGASLRPPGASDATDPEELIADLRNAGDALLGQLQEGGADGVWLHAWAELAAHRNKERHAYSATIAGLLEREGWVVATPEAEDQEHLHEAAKPIREDLGWISRRKKLGAEVDILRAEAIDAATATELHSRRRELNDEEEACLARYQLLERWGLLEQTPELVERGKGGLKPTQTARWLFDAEDDDKRRQLREGWILTTPEALALVPSHDHRAIGSLDGTGNCFAPDRMKVALAQRIFSYVALGLPELLARFAHGEVIASTDSAIEELQATACAHRGRLAAAVGVSPGAYATGTLRDLLGAVGWNLIKEGRINTRGAERGAYTYRAEPMELPEGVTAEALAAVFMAELQAGTAGAKSPHTEKPYMAKKSATLEPAPPPKPAWVAAVANARPIPWGFGAKRPRSRHRPAAPVAA